jgi:hypothetical protein
LGWELNEPDYIACVTLKQLSESPGFCASLEDSSLASLDDNDRTFMDWRLSRPGHVYQNVNNSMILKQFGLQEDIVAINSIPNECHMDTKRYNVLLDANVADLREYEVFKYQFGYRALDPQFSGLKFKKSMLMSDVF